MTTTCNIKHYTPKNSISSLRAEQRKLLENVGKKQETRQVISTLGICHPFYIQEKANFELQLCTVWINLNK